MKKLIAFVICIPLLFQVFAIPASATVNNNPELLVESGWSDWTSPVYSYSTLSADVTTVSGLASMIMAYLGCPHGVATAFAQTAISLMLPEIYFIQVTQQRYNASLMLYETKTTIYMYSDPDYSDFIKSKTYTVQNAIVNSVGHDYENS